MPNPSLSLAHQVAQPAAGGAHPLVSIITPAFRAEATIGRAVRSVLAQQYVHWEMLIVSDDGRDYQQLLRAQGLADPRLRFFATGRVRSGPNVARNVALAEARGELVAPLDADDVYYPERLLALVPHALQYGMSGDNVVVVDEETRQQLGTLFPASADIRWLSLEEYAYTATPMIFVFRRDAIGTPWDEDVDFGADTLFNLRGIETTELVPVMERVMHEYRILPESICHAPGAHVRAERAYAYCLTQLMRTGLGLQTSAGIEVAHGMLLHKQYVNQRYAASVAAGKCHNFQEFAAQSNDATLSLHPVS
jgi:succinoglycan biosynthesis protein ExoO